MTSIDQEQSKKLKIEVFKLYYTVNGYCVTGASLRARPPTESLAPSCKTLPKERRENVYWAIPFTNRSPPIVMDEQIFKSSPLKLLTCLYKFVIYIFPTYSQLQSFNPLVNCITMDEHILLFDPL